MNKLSALSRIGSPKTKDTSELSSNTSKGRKVIIWGIIVLGVAGGAFVYLDKMTKEKTQEMVKTNVEKVFPAITVIPVEKRLLQDVIYTSGQISPLEMVNVSPLVEGQQIETLLVDVGDFVNKNQVLATLSRTALELQKSQVEASLATARASVAQAEAQLLEVKTNADEAQKVNERTSALRKQGAVSPVAADTAAARAVEATARMTVATESFEAAKAQLSLAKAQLKNVELQLSRTEVKAPFGGKISARNAIVGSVASAAGVPMFSIVRDGTLEMKGELSEEDLLRVQKGQKAKLKVAGTQEEIEGTVRLIEPNIDSVTRLGRIRVEIDSPQNVISGMFSEAEVIAVEQEALAVPLTAVSELSDGNFVMKVSKNGVASRQAVSLGIRDGDWVEVTSGLEAGDLIVAKAGVFVRDGETIKPIEMQVSPNGNG